MLESTKHKSFQAAIGGFLFFGQASLAWVGFALALALPNALVAQTPTLTKPLSNQTSLNSNVASSSKLRMSATVLSAITAGTPQIVIVEVAPISKEKATVAAPDHQSALEAASQIGRLKAESMESKLAAFTAAAWYTKSNSNLATKSATVEGISLYRDYEHFPLLAVRLGSASALDALLENSHVVRVYENESYQPTLAQSLPLIRQDAVARLGVGKGDGLGRSVVVIDTGTDYMNGYFGSCSQAEVTADLGLTTSACRIAYQSDFALDDQQFDDSPHKHGTNVAGIVLGVAPSAKVVALDVFQNFDCDSGAPLPAGKVTACGILRGFDWAIQNKNRYKIVAINLSLGNSQSYSTQVNTVYQSAVQNARAAGVATVASAGNSAYSNGLYYDGVSDVSATNGVVSVGATYDSNFLGGGGTNSPPNSCADASPMVDQVACFSQSSSYLSMLAPGYLIQAGGTAPLSGTSQAAPHVAGAFAALSSLFPSESVAQLTTRITTRGPTIFDQRTGRSHKRLDLYAAASNDLTIRSYRAGAASAGVLINLSSAGRIAPEDNEAFAASNVSTVSPYVVRWFVAQKAITLTAPTSDSTGAAFVQWTGCDSADAAARQCTLTVNSSRGVEVYYASGSTPTSGVISVSPSSIAFGSVAVGSTSTRTLTVSNIGTATITLTQAPSLSGPFALASGTTCTTGTQLAPDQSCQFVVAFTPTAATNYSGSFTISSSATNAPTSTAPISGSGISVASTCTYDVIYNGTNASYFGGLTLQGYPQSSTFNLTVATQANCPWNVTSNAPTWFSSSSSGSGNGSAFIQVAENRGLARTGQILVGGYAVTYYQGAYYPANGICGIANGQTFSSTPSANLCSSGIASAVIGQGPWSWTCDGVGGGSNASCSALTSQAITGSTKLMVEFYYAPLNYYFLTSRDYDKQLLDTIMGWSRTGASFKVFTSSVAGTNGVSRYYFDQIARNQTRGSHFYTLLDSDKNYLNGLNPSNLKVPRLPENEGVDSFAYLPTSGVCRNGTIPIYRLFRGNSRFPDDPNHRFTPDIAVYQAFVLAGWDGDGVSLCAPQ